METRKCKRCKIADLSDFAQNRKYCIPCKFEMRKEYNEKNKERIKEHQKEYRRIKKLEKKIEEILS